MPDAGGLVIAPSIEIAEYMANLLEILKSAPILFTIKFQRRTKNQCFSF